MEALANSVQSETEAINMMGSHNHSYLQARFAYLFHTLQSYSVYTELSLDIATLDLTQIDLKLKDELKPDVCLYPKRPLKPRQDILKMSEMPLLVVEILSPRQGVYDIMEKLKVYFAAGVKSCWFVEPFVCSITVFYSMEQAKVFADEHIIDENLHIQFNLADVFS